MLTDQAFGWYGFPVNAFPLVAPEAQNLTLTCAPGSYSLTGTNADLTVTRHYTLVCESASSGAYPDIIVSGAGTTAANGTYVYAGMYQEKPYYLYSTYFIFRTTWEEDELCEWILAVGDFDNSSPLYSSGEVSYIGVDTPDLVTTWQRVGVGSLPVPTVTADAATTYVLTGTDATLTVQRNYTLVCEAGSYTLTGTDTTFEVKRNYVLACSAGNYLITGSDATLTVQRNYTLVCEAGCYTLTGTDTAFGVKGN